MQGWQGAAFPSRHVRCVGAACPPTRPTSRHSSSLLPIHLSTYPPARPPAQVHLRHMVGGPAVVGDGGEEVQDERIFKVVVVLKCLACIGSRKVSHASA